MRPENELAEYPALRVADLWTRPLIAMRPGYVMHRYLMRLLAGREQSFSYAAEGAEMGKQMVAAGLGIALIPDYSVVGDPLVRTGEIVCRPLADDDTEILLVLQRRRSAQVHDAISELHDLFVDHARKARETAVMADAA
jgi:DNA-binding transcriptional LysR family regulator